MTEIQIPEAQTRLEFQSKVISIIQDNHYLANRLANSNMPKIKDLIVSEATKGRQFLLFPLSKRIGTGFRILDNKNYRNSFIDTVEESLGATFIVEDAPSKNSLKISW